MSLGGNSNCRYTNGCISNATRDILPKTTALKVSVHATGVKGGKHIARIIFSAFSPYFILTFSVRLSLWSCDYHSKQTADHCLPYRHFSNRSIHWSLYTLNLFTSIKNLLTTVEALDYASAARCSGPSIPHIANIFLYDSLNISSSERISFLCRRITNFFCFSIAFTKVCLKRDGKIKGGG